MGSMRFGQRAVLAGAVVFVLGVCSLLRSDGGSGGGGGLGGSWKHTPLRVSRDRLTVKGNEFHMGHDPLRIMSGSLHYFRIPEKYWQHRLKAMRHLGLNTLTMYIPWNWHERIEGQYDFESEMHDVAEFITQAGQLGLFVIVRPSPYICAEWEWGGMPAWLMHHDDLQVRTLDPDFTAAVEKYFDVLIPILAPLQAVFGGPIVAFQVENEYGSYGSDVDYMQWQKELLTSRGVVELLMTSDGGPQLPDGKAPGVLQTVNFQSNANRQLDMLRDAQPDKPLMVMEFWSGWFDHWGEGHSVVPADVIVSTLENIIDANSSFNFYMFHGGSNWGFWNGANMQGDMYSPTVTSYDYDALLSEHGEPAIKFWEVRELLERKGLIDAAHLPAMPPLPAAPKAYGTLLATTGSGLFELLEVASVEHLTTTVTDTKPLTMEDARLNGQGLGFVLYRVPGVPERGPLHGTLLLSGIRDRATVCDGAGNVLYVAERPRDSKLAAAEKAVALDKDEDLVVLVENMGRVNYGDTLDQQHKGLLDPIAFRPNDVADQKQGVRLLSPVVTSGLTFGPEWLDQAAGVMPAGIFGDPVPAPALMVFDFQIDDKPTDTFVSTKGWSRGVVFVGTFCLGRYDKAGPQSTMYLPGTLLKQGKNRIMVFETHSVPDEASIKLVSHPRLG